MPATGASVSPLERFLASLSPSTLAPGQQPVASTSSAANELNNRKQQLHTVTRHLVGLATATATARLPVMEVISSPFPGR